MPGCRSKSDYLNAIRGGVLINKDSPQARGLKLWYSGADRLNFDYARSGGRPLVVQSGTPNRNYLGPYGPGVGFNEPYGGSAGEDFFQEQSGLGYTFGHNSTVIFWLRWTYTSLYQGILVNSAGTSGFYFKADSRKFLYYDDEVGDVTNLSDTDVPEGQDVCVGVTINNDGTGTFWLNGVADGAFSVGDYDGFQPRRVGSDGVGFDLNGALYEIRIWNHTFTPQEVFALYDPRTRYDLYWKPSCRGVRAPSVRRWILGAH